MSPGAQSLAVILVTFALYLSVPVWLLFKGWVLRAGVAWLAVTFLPVVAQAILWPDSAGNFGLLVIVLAPWPLLLIAAGLLAGAVRIGAWAWRRARPTTVDPTHIG